MSSEIPQSCDVLVIGGGPAGSSAATLLAQAGIEVVLLERSLFPRQQVGESLIPHFWKFADMTGVSSLIEQEGFLQKAGSITVWEQQIRQIKFSEFGYTRPGLHIERDIFDDLLLKHARNCGASVFHEVAVKKVDFSDEDWPEVVYLDKRENSSKARTIRCRYVVDASGHSSVLANQFNTRHTICSETNYLSLWGYYKNSRFVGVDRKSHTKDKLDSIKPVTFVMSFEQGWLWHIVLRDKTSVGLVVPTHRTKGMGKQQREQFFLETCEQLPYISILLEEAQYISGSLQFRPDYSYYATQICGDNYYCIGDSGAFVDPIFSHGVQNALYNAAIASMAIKESLQNKANRKRYSQLCESRMQQFYGFSRALTLGDFGCNGVNTELVKKLMKSLSPLEMELIMVVSTMTNRSENFIRMAKEAGVWANFEQDRCRQKSQQIDALSL